MARFTSALTISDFFFFIDATIIFLDDFVFILLCVAHSQILSKHKNEIRGIKHILRETRACRNHLAKQLQTTEHRLLHTKANLQHLEVLSRDRHLWDRERLSLRLNEATTELQDKQRRISVLEYKVLGMAVTSSKVL